MRCLICCCNTGVPPTSLMKPGRGEAMSKQLDRKELLQRSWTEVASGYQKQFVPRFMPWTLQTIQTFLDAQPPPGDVVVPCCGPGQELEILASRLPGHHRIIGVDLSEGMIQLAQQRITQLGIGDRVEARVGDAASLDARDLAGVVSVFGLQQIPEPGAVLASWVRALRPRGVLAVCYWGQEVEEEGPWQRLMALTAATRPQGDWEAGIPSSALESVRVRDYEGAVQEGAEIVQDCHPAHTMNWPSVEAFWEGMTRSGPWHSRLLQYGEEHMELLKREFMRAYPDPSAPLTHRAYARLVVLRRLAAAL